jgi:hypothetical protein
MSATGLRSCLSASGAATTKPRDKCFSCLSFSIAASTCRRRPEVPRFFVYRGVLQLEKTIPVGISANCDSEH